MQALAPGLSWWYNWYHKPDAGAAAVYPGLGVDYVPMQWGRQLDGQPFTADQLAATIPAGTTYLLGFNEPNFRSQANLTPTQAAALWPMLEDVARRRNLKLVSPAVNYCGDCVSENGTTYYSPTQYLDAFFAACPTCRVDYIAVHTYVCEERWLREKIGELRKYNKPIWLTEFSCGDMPHSQITLATQKKYLTDAVNYLENEPAVFRYAWFSGRNNEIPNINLLGNSGQLTELGQLYVSLPAAGSTPVEAVLKPVSATASSNQTTTSLAALAIDGDPRTRWSSQWADPQYLQLDFGADVDITRVKITWEAAYAKDYQLLTSSNGTSWTPIHSILNGDGGTDDITGLSVRGRYLRINGTRRATAFGYSIYEVAVYGRAVANATKIEAESFAAMQGIQVEPTTDADGGQNVGYIDAGDWLSYASVRFPTAGTYTIEYRVASPNGSSLSADLTGSSTQLGTVPIPATGEWQRWTTISQTVTVPTGTYTLNVRAVGGGWNLNWLRITKVSGARTAVAATPLTLTDAPDRVDLYPNPVTDFLLIRTHDSLTGSRYRIVDTAGRPVLTGAVAADRVNVSTLTSGSYLLQVLPENKSPVTLRFLKQ
ncbi:hypothetical protein GCM10027423_61290 [Spirosoma arcticum]